MKRDNDKITVDLKLKNSENITDIDDMTAEYVPDEEFEKLIRDGLDDSWEDLGLSVSEDLISRTMQAIKEHAPEGTETTVNTEAAGSAAGGSADRTRIIKFRRFTRIAAGIAAAVIVGIVGIGLARGGLFLSKSAKSDSMTSGNSNANMAFSTSSSAKDTSDVNMAYEENVQVPATAESIAEADSYSDESPMASAASGQLIQSINAGEVGTSDNGVYDSEYYEAASDSMESADEDYYAPQTTDADASDDSIFEDMKCVSNGEYTDGDTLEGINRTGTWDIAADIVDDEEVWNEITEYIMSVEVVRDDAAAADGKDTVEDSEDSGILYVVETYDSEYRLLRYYVFPDSVLFTRSTVLDHQEPEDFSEEYPVDDADAVIARIQEIIAQHSGE